jgi:hypothetical protein
MPAPIFLPVAWMRKIDFMLGWAVGNHGVGIVAKNTVLFTTILRLENDVTMQKTIIMDCVAVKSLDSKKKTIVRADIQDTVVVGGKSCFQ